MMKEDKLKFKAKQLRKLLLQLLFKINGAWVGSCLSCVDLLTALYFGGIFHFKCSQAKKKSQDVFILSKGHAVAALYVVLLKSGFFPLEKLNREIKNNSLPLHAVKNSFPGIEVSAGSLGHGLAIGAGIAWADKHDQKASKTVVLLSDGECEEGEVWETALFAAHHHLDNLVAIVDYNKIQAFGFTNKILCLEPFLQKWESFGWQGKEINGHNFQEIMPAMSKLPLVAGKPTVIIAHTFKGKGVSFMENNLLWHYQKLDSETLNKALKELI